ncbi:MAG TPA: TonB C-terminal domain-containing protein [Stellaceae bacterium]|nr:TonB C-terminal domain-containing protein [Stellaceae bacterium]
MTDAVLPPDERLPPPVVDRDIDGVFHLPPSADARRETIAVTTFIAALLLHLLVLAALLYEWRAVARPAARPIQVTLLREAPKPPPPPQVEKKPEPPKPKAEQPKPPPPPKAEEKPKPPPEPPKPVEMKPRESGADDKTEAAKTAEPPKEALPKELPVQPKAEEVKPPPEPQVAVPEPKPTPPRARIKENAAGRGVMVPLPMPLPAPDEHRPTAPPIRNLVVRLPGPGGGRAEHDSAGDAYLNNLRDLLERNRIYPPAEAFAGVGRLMTAYSVLIEPSGRIVNITRYEETGVPAIDEASRQMIENLDPFPHLPADYPQIRTLITFFVPMFPRR